MSRLMDWMRGLSTPVQLALVVGVVLLLALAMWLALDLSWLPGWLGS